MQVRLAFVADAEPFELVQPSEGALDHPSGFAEARAVGDPTAGDEGLDTSFPQQAAVLVVVVAAVGKQSLGLAPGSAPQSSNVGNPIEKRDQLGDVVPVSASQRDSKRGAAAVDEYMVLGARAAAVDRRRPDVVPPLRALT